MRKLVVSAIVLCFLLSTMNLLAAAAGCPTLDYPPDNAANVPRDASDSVTVKWNAVAGATGYDVRWGTAGACAASPRATVAGTTWSPPAAEVFDGATYEWSVTALGVAGCTSECRTFTMATCPAAGPALVSPANNSIEEFGTVTLTWSPVPNASLYEVIVAVDGGPPNIVGVVTGTQKDIIVGPGREIQWLVKALAPGCDGQPSSIFVFNTTCLEDGPDLTNPNDGDTFPPGQPIAFSWGPVGGASGYDLQVSSDGASWDNLAENLANRTYVASLDPGTWQWRVRANFEGDCEPAYSEKSTFVVTDATTCDNLAPQLVSPADHATISLPGTLDWNGVANAALYHVMLKTANGVPQRIGSTTRTSFDLVNLAPGTYEWAIVADFEDCPDTTSAPRMLTIEPRECPTAKPQPTSPPNGATVSSPVLLSWSAVANVELYRVYASIDGDAPTLLVRTTANSATVGLPSGKVRWRVEALREGCPPVFSSEGELTVETGSNCAPNQAPSLVSPVGTAGDPALVRNPVGFAWSALANAIAYRVWVAGDDQPFQDIGLTKETHLEKVLPSDTYRWFVQALFNNCPPVPSAIGHFRIQDDAPRCSDEVPTILEPANGATVSKLRFRVVEIPTAVRYRFFAIVDRTNAEPEILLLGSSPRPELEADLPPGTYQAFAEAVFEECKSTFSPRISFTILRGQNCDENEGPELLSPANGAQVLTQSSDLFWKAVAGAQSYVVVLQSGDGAPTPSARTTGTQVTLNLPPGRIQWRVFAFFPNCEPEPSEVSHFEVVAPSRCITRKPILFLPPSQSEVTSPVFLVASEVPNATGYDFWVWQDGEEPAVVASSDDPRARVELSPGTYLWFVEADIEGCDSSRSAVGELTVVDAEPCGTPGKPRAHVVGQALSSTPYRLRWTTLPHIGQWEVQESLTDGFEDPQTFLTDEPVMLFEHEVANGSVKYHYRVRGLSDCNDQSGPYSDVVSVNVSAQRTNNASAEVGTAEDIVQKLFLPGPAAQGAATNFSVTVDKPWLKVEPSSGVLPPEGITLTLTGDPDALNLGTNTATVKVTSTDAAGNGLQTQATSTFPVPINISLVTPVNPGGKSAPPPDALIFPIVGHAAGANDSLFESDIRLTNLGAQTMKYQVNFTPSGVDGTTNGSSTTLDVAPNQTVALDDVVASLFGTGTTNILGMLEVRPLTTAVPVPSGFAPLGSTIAPLLTAASSRTYNFTPAGTFGQFIPAVPFAKFVGRATSGPNPILTLQQVAQSLAFRANFGFAEASGQPAELVMRVYDIAGTLLATIPISLGASQHQQLNGLLANNGINDLADGRVEIEVTSGNGKVTAYVSEIDNRTNDPLLVTAVAKGSVSSNRYVLPGMAYIDNGFAFWVSDLRVFNAGTTSTPATLTFYPEANPGAAVSKAVVLDAGEIEVLDNVVGTFFGQPKGAGGQIVITTPQNTTLTATARTYNQTANGTYGQFIPGITPAESIGAADRALQILQLETSPRLRSNIGLSETTGNPVTVEVSVIQSDSIVTPFVQIPLAGNEFRQISLAGFFPPDSAVYNARVTVKVIGGTGRVTAYGSAIDAITQDPTYVTAQ